MSYVFMLYEISAVLAAFCLLPLVDRFFDIARASSSKRTNQTFDRAAVLIVLLIFILVPVLNTLFVMHCVHCYFRYPDAE